MAEIKKDLYYYWTHDKEYERLKAEDMNDDAVLALCEEVLMSFREEKDHVVRNINRLPNDEGCINAAKAIKRDLETPFLSACMMGHGDEVINDFVASCPEGVFD